MADNSEKTESGKAEEIINTAIASELPQSSVSSTKIRKPGKGKQPENNINWISYEKARPERLTYQLAIRKPRPTQKLANAVFTRIRTADGKFVFLLKMCHACLKETGNHVPMVTPAGKNCISMVVCKDCLEASKKLRKSFE